MEEVLSPLARKRLGAVFQVMQQRAAVSSGSGFTPIVLPAKVIPTTSASNIVSALEDSLTECTFCKIEICHREVRMGLLCNDV